jgi:hypothetical protein
LHFCRRCSRAFRVDPSGGITEVVKKKDGKWVDKLAYQGIATWSRAARLLARRVLPAAALVGLVLLGYRLTLRPAPAQQPDLPRELQPRAEMFTKAWLKKDWSLMRRFAAPGEDRALYNWSVRHPPPAKAVAAQSDADLPVEAVVLSTQTQPITVKVRIGSAPGKSGVPPFEVLQFWQEHEAGWFLCPETKAGSARASIGSGARSSSR